MSNKAMEKIIVSLTEEVSRLRSATISLVGKDSEGLYKPNFVKRILENSKEKVTRKFTTPANFLEQIL